MSKKFAKVKRYYDEVLWTKAMVANAVAKGWITAEEYEIITGEPYEG
ncbi:MAG: XkdX family protein [Ruminococcus sp.]|nr:XkdX family protein [Ruminococcus sp.]